jgi:broad specificity phosphatase PhoE
MIIYFVRHGEVENPGGVKYGRLPGFPLTSRGKLEIEATADKLKGLGIEAIYASSLLRTKQSAEIISEKLNIPIIYDDRLLEHDHGKYTGVPVAEYVKMEYWRAGAETLENCGDRVLDFLYDMKSQNKYQKIAIVGHQGPIVMAILNKAGKSVEEYDTIDLPVGGVIQYEF